MLKQTGTGRAPLHDAALAGDWAGIHEALAAGVRIDLQAARPEHDKLLSHEGATALHLAARGGHAEICARLIGRGADVGALTARCQTPLHYAAWEAEPATVGTLLGEGADPNARDDQQQTPLHLVARTDRIRSVVLLLRRGAEPGPVSVMGMTPLHHAAIRGQERVARRLVDAGCPVDLRDQLGRTAADWARDQGQADLGLWLDEPG